MIRALDGNHKRAPEKLSSAKVKNQKTNCRLLGRSEPTSKDHLGLQDDSRAIVAVGLHGDSLSEREREKERESYDQSKRNRCHSFIHGMQSAREVFGLAMRSSIAHKTWENNIF